MWNDLGVFRVARYIIVLLAATTLPGCLPGDSRPEPGSLYVTAAASPATTEGLTTPDGWTVSFERLLAGIGSIQIEGEGCNGYSEPRYTRLFDFAEPMPSPQKVAQAYGLGTCELGFELSPPQVDALLGQGVTAADLELMRVELKDAWIRDPEQTSVRVIGTATRGSIVKQFEWVFRMEYDIERCAEGKDGQPGSTLVLEGGAEVSRTIVIDAAELFRESADPEAPLRFDALAESDADADGVITLEELDKVAAPVVPDMGPSEGGSAPGTESPTLADLLYDTLVPRMARPAGSGLCEFELDNRPW